jgi:hypothetical protein
VDCASAPYVTQTGTVREMRPDGRSSNLGLPGAVRRYPTPKASDGERGGRGDLLQVVRGNESPSGHYRSFPTPNAGSSHWGGTMQEWGGSGSWVRDFPELASGQLNPEWVEWLMGFPPGWTDLEDSATP